MGECDEGAPENPPPEPYPASLLASAVPPRQRSPAIVRLLARRAKAHPPSYRAGQFVNTPRSTVALEKKMDATPAPRDALHPVIVASDTTEEEKYAATVAPPLSRAAQEVKVAPATDRDDPHRTAAAPPSHALQWDRYGAARVTLKEAHGVCIKASLASWKSI